MPPPPSSRVGHRGGGRVRKAGGVPASQPLVPEGAKFSFAVAFEKAGTSDGHLGLHLVYGSLYVEFKDELVVDNAIYCLC